MRTQQYRQRLADEQASLQAGAAFGRSWLMLRQGTVADDTAWLVFLSGDLGAGKTTFTRGFLHACGYTGVVKSPTYTLVEPYNLEGFVLYHFDLYRLGDPDELEFTGARDCFGEHAICLIEWPEMAEGALPQPDLRCDLRVDGTGRILSVCADTGRGAHWLRQSS